MKAQRLLALPPYLFEDLDRRCREAVADGRDVIDLSIGDPDLPPPESLVENLKRALERTRHHRYPPQRGSAELKVAIQSYLSRRCGLKPSLDEILVLVGSKEGIGHLPLAVCDPDCLVLLPDPGYPVYHAAAQFAGARVGLFALDRTAGYAPLWGELSEAERRSARMLVLNYPNNPTGATVDVGTFDEALNLAKSQGTIVVNDAAYADVYFGEKAPPLLCGRAGALECPVIEFFSFSKTFCVTGWRVGFAVGRRDVIDALAHLKANIDSGVFGAIQEAVARTLGQDGDAYAAKMRIEYGLRRERAVGALAKLGFECTPGCATFYVWVKVPRPYASADYAVHLLERADVLVTPGAGFGRRGEGFFRIALTQPLDRIEEALSRMGRV
jgi:LL-diaminopimelate aminotransferase